MICTRIICDRNRLCPTWSRDKIYIRRKETMKKILSLILVVVMLALTLTSCSYNYADDSMSNYATVDAEAFKAALKSLKIEDGDFTADEAVRKQKVIETIYNTIGKEADLTDKKTEGVVGTYDILFYSYYCVANFGEGSEAVRLANSNMKSTSAIKLQLGMTSTADELEKAIMDALKDNDIKDHLYETKTEGELKVGDIIYVSYTLEKSDNTKTNVKYKEMTLGDDDLSTKIIENCKTVGAEKKTFNVGADAYKDVVVDWAVNSEKTGELLGSFEVTDYDKDGKATDENGTERKFSDIKDGKITYYVYPVYYVKTAEFTAELVLDTLLGANAAPEVMDVFEDESYKATVDGKEVTLATLVKELAALCSKRDDAETALEDAEETLETKKAAYDKAEATEAGATDLQEKEWKDAEKAVADAKKKLEDEKKNVTDKIAVILGINAELGDKIIKGYEELAYDSLENDYNNDIIEKLAVEIWALIEASVKVNSCPVKAVDEAAERILENHKYTFYTGTKNTTTKESYYKAYNGKFEDYLIDTFAKNKTYDDALAAIREDATEAVTEIVKLYAVAEVFECVATDAEYNEDFVKGNSSYDYYVETYGETNLRTAYQFDKLLSTILEVETYEEDEGDHKKGEIKDYVDGKLPFKDGKVSYIFKTEEDKSDDK